MERKEWVIVEDFEEGWYRMVYAEVRAGRTLRQVRYVMTHHGCDWSIGSWSKYARGELKLSWAARNALRSYMGEDLLSPPVETLVAGLAVERVVQEVERPSVVILTHDSPSDSLVTSVTSPRRARSPRLGKRYVNGWESGSRRLGGLLR